MLSPHWTRRVATPTSRTDTRFRIARKRSNTQPVAVQRSSGGTRRSTLRILGSGPRLARIIVGAARPAARYGRERITWMSARTRGSDSSRARLRHPEVNPARSQFIHDVVSREREQAAVHVRRRGRQSHPTCAGLDKVDAGSHSRRVDEQAQRHAAVRDGFRSDPKCRRGTSFA